MRIPEKMDEVLVTRRENDRIIVMGQTKGFPTFLYRTIYGPGYRVIEDSSWMRYDDSFAGIFSEIFIVPRHFRHVRERFDGDKRFDNEVYQHQQRNMQDLDIAAERVPIYQLTLGEIEQKVGRAPEIVDTGTPLNFIEADDSHSSWDRTLWRSKDWWLRVKAARMGADAIAYYQAGSPARGTPIKLKD